MGYEPLHHKYRPQVFADLVGQAAIATTLTHAIEQQKIAPAYLFCGPRGTGKTSSARILAKSLNCINGDAPTASPCGKCEVCRTITHGSALDVLEIDAASNTGVDNIRELIEKSQFAPIQCRYKVYVIDECHMLSTAAFNALLKTLEEPPQRVVFVLATTDPQRVLPTIISRCQRFDFRRISLDAMVPHLQTIAHEEKITITEDALTLIAQIAQGGLRDAESLLDQLSLLAEGVTIEKVWDLVGAVPEQDLFALVQAIAQNQPETVLDQIRRLMDRGREPLIVLQNLTAFYRDLLIAKTAPHRHDLVALTRQTWDAICPFVQAWEVEFILAAQQQLRTSEVQVKHTTQPRLWLEVVLLSLLPSAISPALSHPTPPTTGITAPIFSTPSSSSSLSASVPSVSPTPNPVNFPSSASTGSHGSTVWQQILNHISLPSTRALMQQMGHLIALDDGCARIGLQPQVYKKRQANLAKDIATLEAALAKVGYPHFKVTLEAAIRVSEVDDKSPPPLTQDAPPSAPVGDRPTETPHPSIPPVSSNLPQSSGAPSVSESQPRSSISPPDRIINPVVSQLPAIPDEGRLAAESLAQFFNGQVVSDDDLEMGDFPPLSGMITQGLGEAEDGLPF